jgi:hypothetical protein
MTLSPFTLSLFLTKLELPDNYEINPLVGYVYFLRNQLKEGFLFELFYYLLVSNLFNNPAKRYVDKL